MPRGKTKDRDGIYTRADRPGTFWGSWIDASGKRRQRKLEAHTLTQARIRLNEEKSKVADELKLGHAPPSKESFAEFAEGDLAGDAVGVTSVAARQHVVVRGARGLRRRRDRKVVGQADGRAGPHERATTSEAT